ncbi:MAG TPA: ribonuclease P protein component [Accumulibacter sp.]|nr:ribonuclease P protein component [Accumulibacter sp.]HMW17734.1 ribonuclease P protein component [Accumulibacter sp.]HMX21634.1 ribonuclease P protein component [Accumulibacter sp.]HMY06208.1 ribonuclease P protein component [Accumulibacter sp.]HNC19207.1 ribonuclease P protein component [Accumulibacter sp.]
MIASGRIPGDAKAAANGFPKSYRLIRTDEYSSVFGFKRALRSRHFLLHYRPRGGEEAGGARLGLVVAKRFIRRAVDRNLLRRLSRENFRLLRPHLKACDFVLRVATKPTAIDRRAMSEEIRQLLNKMTLPS